jgi:hypothetical protein
MFRRALILAPFVIACLLGASRADAQIKLEITPFFTSYYSTNDLRFIDKDNLERQEAGPGIGTGLAWRFSEIWSVEAQGAYVLSRVVQRNTELINFEPPDAGNLVLANARVVFQPRRFKMYLTAGAGIIKRGGDAWELPGLEETQVIEGILGVGMRAAVVPNRWVRFGVEMHMYNTDPDGVGDYYTSRMQRDVYVTIGMPIALIGR